MFPSEADSAMLDESVTAPTPSRINCFMERKEEDSRRLW